MKQVQFLGFLAIILILYSSCINDSYINVRDLPVPDCSGKSSVWNEFTKNETNLLVIPDHPSDSIEFYRMFSYKKSGYVDSLIRRENELTTEDYKKGLEIYGEIGDFKSWDKFNLPFYQINKGFKFKNVRYTNKEDGFFYITKDRMVYSGNSLAPIWKQQTTYATYYKYILFENGLLSKLCISDAVVIDINKIRSYNYNRVSTKYFQLFIDKKLGELDINDSFLLEICNRMELELPVIKINAFLHDDPNATRLFANFYFATGCDTLPNDMKFGTVQIDGIHTTGKDIEFVKHETFHYIWGNLIGESQGNDFFNEGIQEYYQQLLDPSRITTNVQIAKKYEEYNITDLVLRGNHQDFWGGPSENNWPIAYNISGLFVKFLVDKEGLDAFKDFYTSTDKKNAFMASYNMSYLEILDEYQDWINEF